MLYLAAGEWTFSYIRVFLEAVPNEYPLLLKVDSAKDWNPESEILYDGDST